MDYKDQITVEELIELLKTMPKGSLVWSEGCDCIGAVSEVTYNESDNSVMLNRCN